MKSTAGKQAAKDANSTADKEEPDSEQQQGLADDGCTDGNNLGNDSGSDSTQLSKQGLHSGGSISNKHLLISYERAGAQKCQQHRPGKGSQR